MSALEPEASLMESYVLIFREEWKNCQQWTAFKKNNNLVLFMDCRSSNIFRAGSWQWLHRMPKSSKVLKTNCLQIIESKNFCNSQTFFFIQSPRSLSFLVLIQMMSQFFRLGVVGFFPSLLLSEISRNKKIWIFPHPFSNIWKKWSMVKNIYIEASK